MKNPILFLFALIATLSACNDTPKQSAFAPIQPPKNHLTGYSGGSPVIQTYTQYLRSLDTLDLSTSQLAQKVFDSLFHSQSPEVCDTGFMLFWDFQNRLNNTDSIAELFIRPVTLDTITSAQYQHLKLDARQQAARQKLWDNNFIIGEEEGTSYITPGWQLVDKHFIPYVSPAMKDVLTENANEEEQGFMMDAGLVIDAPTLAGRTTFWERFLTQYPHHMYDSMARSHYNVLLYVLVSGSDNISVTENDTSYTLTPYFDSVYHMIMDYSPESRTNTVIKPFYEAIRARDAATMKHIRDSVPLY